MHPSKIKIMEIRLRILPLFSTDPEVSDSAGVEETSSEGSDVFWEGVSLLTGGIEESGDDVVSDEEGADDSG